jgi:hypothetical protein
LVDLSELLFDVLRESRERPLDTVEALVHIWHREPPPARR